MNIFKSFKITCIIIMFCLIGCGTKTEKKIEEKKEDVFKVKTIIVEKREMEIDTYLVGTASAEDELTLKTDVYGRVDSVNVEEGDNVNKGQVIAKLDMSEIRLQLAQEKLLLQDAMSELNKSELDKKEEILQIEKELTNSEADYLRKKLLLSKAKNEYETKEKLFRINAASLEELKQAEIESKKADIDFQASKKNYDTILKLYAEEKNLRLEKNDILIKKAKNNIERSKVEIKKIERELSKYIIKSPLDGMISELYIKPYMYINQGALDIAEIIGFNNIIVKTNVSESDIGKIKKGDEVKILFDAVKDQDFYGKVVSVKPVIDSSTRSFPVNIRVGNSTNIIKPGMFCKIQLSTINKKEGIFIPYSIVRKAGSSEFVFKVKNNIAVRSVIKTGRQTQGLIEIESGLNSGDILVSEGIDKIKDLSKVEIIK